MLFNKGVEMSENEEVLLTEKRDIESSLSEKTIFDGDPMKAMEDSSFYTDAVAYWDKIPATLDGVLGGFGNISPLDLCTSQAFLKGLFNMSYPPGHVRAVDCGAGIGRVTNGLLQKYFGKVDLVEQCPAFIDKAKENLVSSNKVGNYYCMGLQDFHPPPNTYDVVWCQWVLSHLTDDDLKEFFIRMASSLRPNGVIVLKENISQEAVELDDEDSSVTRPECLFVEIFRSARLKVIRNMAQKDLPKSFYDVRMFCLKPIQEDCSR